MISVILNVILYMEKKKEWYLPVDYAKFRGVTPSAVTRMMNEGRVEIRLIKGRRYIKA